MQSIVKRIAIPMLIGFATCCALPAVSQANRPHASNGVSMKHARLIVFRNGKGRAVVTGRIGGGDNPVYRFYARAGRTLSIAFRQPQGSGLVLAWNIDFPSGKRFGTKGYDPFDGHLTENGEYTLSVGRNNMATNEQTGTFRMILTLKKPGRHQASRQGVAAAATK